MTLHRVGALKGLTVGDGDHAHRRSGYQPSCTVIDRRDESVRCSEERRPSVSACRIGPGTRSPIAARIGPLGEHHAAVHAQDGRPRALRGREVDETEGTGLILVFDRTSDDLVPKNNDRLRTLDRKSAIDLNSRRSQ